MMRVLLSLVVVLGVAMGASAQTAAPAEAGAAAPTAGPAAAGNAYSATVPVAGTGDDQRNAAIATALGQVLQRVAPGFTASPDVLAQASGYVRDFRYQRAASGNGLQLQVDFDPGAIGRLVATNQAAAGAATPATGSSAAGAAQGGSGKLWVDGISDSHAFASLLSTLRADTALHGVVPVEAAGDGVMLRLDYDQSLAAVLAGLTSPGGHLALAAQPHAGADASLHWTP